MTGANSGNEMLDLPPQREKLDADDLEFRPTLDTEDFEPEGDIGALHEDNDWIGEVSAGTGGRFRDIVATPEVVIGDDDRRRISDTQHYPWSAVCQLVITNRDESTSVGTGWFIGNRAVATAAHNVFNHRHGGLARRIKIFPGRDGDFALFSLLAADYDIDPRWRSTGQPQFDFAALFINRHDVGPKTGAFEYRALPSDILRSLTVENVGYPYAPDGNHPKPLGTLWRNASKVSDVDSSHVFYSLDTEFGQSGSPIFGWSPAKKPVAVAIHTTGDETGNYGRRIDDDVFDILRMWSKYPDGILLKNANV